MSHMYTHPSWVVHWCMRHKTEQLVICLEALSSAGPIEVAIPAFRGHPLRYP